MLELAKSCTFEPIVLNMCARWGGFAEKNREEEEEMKSPKLRLHLRVSSKIVSK